MVARPRARTVSDDGGRPQYRNLELVLRRFPGLVSYCMLLGNRYAQKPCN
jgi:hypothetical protein